MPRVAFATPGLSPTVPQLLARRHPTVRCLAPEGAAGVAFGVVENVLAPPVHGASADLTDAQTREAAAQRAFSTSILVSATRCLLTYIVLPFAAPALGLATGVGPGLGIAIGLVAIGSNVLTIRRFHAARHRWRWGYTAISVTVVAMLLVLMAQDILDLFG